MQPKAQVWIPTVIEKTGRSERAYDIYSRLLEDRIVFVGTPITDTVANIVIAQLLFLQKENKSQEISLYINSPGGYVSDGLAIYDTMQFTASARPCPWGRCYWRRAPKASASSSRTPASCSTSPRAASGGPRPTSSATPRRSSSCGTR